MNKTTKIAVLMDDIAGIKAWKDTSFAMLLEASRRGFEVWTFDSCDMFFEAGRVLANVAKTTVVDNLDNFYVKDEVEVMALAEFEVILMRKDPPFDMNYIYATYLLELAENQGVMVVNRPQALRDANEKLFALNFPECLPKTYVGSNFQHIKAFIEVQKTVVVKPLDGMGGADIFKLKSGDSNIDEVLKHLIGKKMRPIMVQVFLPEIEAGDKRILLIDGKPIDYALARMPAAGSFKGNLAAGAIGVGQPLSPRDYWLCEQIAPALRKSGLMFVGLDVIGDYITEINVTSPTCVRELDAEFGLNIAGVLFDEIARKLSLQTV